MKNCTLAVLAVASVASVTSCPAAFAHFYVSGKVGVTDLVVNTSQFVYINNESPRSTVVDGTISDINATYYAAIGYDYRRMFRLDAEYSYGRYVASGGWSVNSKNMVPTTDGVVVLPPYFSYPASYTLTDTVHNFVLNGYYNVVKFNRRFRNRIYKDINQPRLHTYDAMYAMLTAGVAHIREKGSVGIDTTMAWGGNPINQTVTTSLTRFVYGAGLGLSFGLCPEVFMDLAYKYLRMGNLDDGLTHREYSSHNIMLGLRYQF